jgi:hypothetical protein
MARRPRVRDTSQIVNDQGFCRLLVNWQDEDRSEWMADRQDDGRKRHAESSHYRKSAHFRRPKADENRPNADENSRFRRLPDENRPTK